MPKNSKSCLIEPTQHLIKKYILGRKPRRLHTTHSNIGSLLHFRTQKCEMKPVGLWYGFGDSWMQWCLSEQSKWLQPYVYEVVANEKKILRITNEKEFAKFEQKYVGVPEYMKMFGDDFLMPFNVSFIDWGKVAEKYCGLEIMPYLWSKRLESIWYYGWDCASGVVWHKDGVKEFRSFASIDKVSGEFVRTK